MLYDPKWELSTLIRWLETKPADKEYDYTKPKSCLVAQWLVSCGATYPILTVGEVKNLWGGKGDDIVRGQPRTFGGALKRAQAHMIHN